MIRLKIKYGNSQTDLRFPCTEKALQEALAEIDAEQVRPLELYVTEVVFPEELALMVVPLYETRPPRLCFSR